MSSEQQIFDFEPINNLALKGGVLNPLANKRLPVYTLERQKALYINPILPCSM